MLIKVLVAGLITLTLGVVVMYGMLELFDHTGVYNNFTKTMALLMTTQPIGWMVGKFILKDKEKKYDY